MQVKILITGLSLVLQLVVNKIEFDYTQIKQNYSNHKTQRKRCYNRVGKYLKMSNKT